MYISSENEEKSIQKETSQALDRLNFLFQVKLVNIRNDDITDGKHKLTLGLIWTIILHFQVRSLVLVTQFVHGLETCVAFCRQNLCHFSVFG